MRVICWLLVLGASSVVALVPEARAQAQTGRPYIAYAYPAGGQQGTTFEVKAGGQNLAEVTEVIVNGSGVTAKVVDRCDSLGNRESSLLGQQLRELRNSKKKDEATQQMMAKIEKLLREDVRFPACAAFRSIIYIEITIATNAPPGERELRLVTQRGGPSNPTVFHVGQVPEYTRPAMRTAARQVLGREGAALRNRPPEEAEKRVNIPCTTNGQIASRETNRYRFTARKGQRLVITTQARQLIPYIADAVPGWFQPVLVLYDAGGKEVAYDDDYQFKPDPVILYEVPKDGEYVLDMHDAIYRGRNDFIYRITIGETPFITSVFPLGGRAGQTHDIKMKGWNLDGATLTPPAKDAVPGIHQLAANRNGTASNTRPFALDTLPEILEQESSQPQPVTLPVIINGRIDQPDDWDVFQFTGKAGDTVVAEVMARRLDSPLDSVVKLTDAAGNLLALNDDREDLGAGVNTHHADSYFMTKLPADGAYYVHIGDTARNGSEDCAYRLRISAPRPDFELRTLPSSVALRGGSAGSVAVLALRKDGFVGDITLDLRNPPDGFTATPAIMTGTQTIKQVSIRAKSFTDHAPVSLVIAGVATVDGVKIQHDAVPTEDRMQAFLWRHLVPAQALTALVLGPRAAAAAEPLRTPPELTPAQLAKAQAVTEAAKSKGQQFTKQQVAGFARNIRSLYEKGLLTDKFYGDRIAELGLTQ
jgi:hypothetical protein